MALPQVDDVSDFHCVTTWSRYDNHWSGVRFRTLAELAVPKDEAQFVLCTGYDCMPDSDIPYTTNLPLERAIEDDVLLVHTWEGKPLPAEHGGPLRMITPKLYAWKGTKWIRKIEFLGREPARLLGTARLFELRRALVQRPLFDSGLTGRVISRRPRAAHRSRSTRRIPAATCLVRTDKRRTESDRPAG